MAAFVLVSTEYVYEDSQAFGWVDFYFIFLISNISLFGPLLGLKPGMSHILTPTHYRFPMFVGTSK